MSTPYDKLPAHQFWRRSVARVEPHRLDPVTDVRFRLTDGDKVATAGSCFAQHIARALRQVGPSYYVAETAPADLSEAEASARNFGVFSARYGNIYTARQLLQLLAETEGKRTPHERAWARRDGRFVDPYRPQIEPAGFATPEDVADARAEHLLTVRRMFATATVFVFTLGLTEAWRSRRDGAVFPLAPGVAGGRFDPAEHEFHNFTAAEVEDDLRTFIRMLQGINPGCRVLLTVSPVPLIATYEPKHVMVSTAYSKAALRVAAEGIVRQFPHVDYFPSYEIITGQYNRGAYYEPDLRDVTRTGVDHAMRVFLRHYAGQGTAPPAQPHAAPRPAQAKTAADTAIADDAYDVVCDEEAIDQVRP